MECGRKLCQVRLPGLQNLRDRTKKRGDQQHAGQPVDQVADRKPVTGRVIAARTFEKRIDRAAEIGAKYKGQRRRRRDELRIGQRHDKENTGHARMHQPGDEGANDDAQRGIAGNRVHE